jgi:hypothetical protein
MLLPGMPHPMVPIAIAGDAAFYRITQERGSPWRNVLRSFRILGVRARLPYFKR